MSNLNIKNYASKGGKSKGISRYARATHYGVLKINSCYRRWCFIYKRGT